MIPCSGGRPLEASRRLEDQLCAVAMFLLMFEALAERVRLLEQAILKQPEMWQLLGERLIPREYSLDALL